MLIKRKKKDSGIKFREGGIPMRKSNGIKFKEGGYYDYVSQRKSSPRIVEIDDREVDQYPDEDDILNEEPLEDKE